MMNRPRTGLSLALWTLLFAGGCSQAIEEDLQEEIPLPPEVRTIRMRIPLGGITVVEGAERVLKFAGRARKTADAPEDLKKLETVSFRPVFRPTEEPGVYEYSTPDMPEGVDTKRAALILRGTLTLPPDVGVDIETFRGALAVYGRSADVRLETASGDLNLQDIHGSLKARTHRGTVLLSGQRGGCDIETGEGAVFAQIEDVGEGVRLQTQGKSITVHLPKEAGFDLDARVEKCEPGKIAVRNSFDVPVEPDGDGHRAKGQVAGGGPKVELVVGRGWLSVVPLRKSASDSSSR